MSGVLQSVNVAGFMEPEGGGISILAPISLRIDALSKKIVSPHRSSP
jgi:hypothetical protein